MLDKLWQVQATLGNINPLEDSSMVCQRLGIDVDMHRAMLKALLDDIAGWSAQLRASAGLAELDKLFIRGRGIKGSCLSLGAPRIARHLATIDDPAGSLQAELEPLPAYTLPGPAEAGSVVYADCRVSAPEILSAASSLSAAQRSILSVASQPMQASVMDRP